MIQLPGTRPILDPSDFSGLQDRIKGEGPSPAPQLAGRGCPRLNKAWGRVTSKNSPETFHVPDRCPPSKEAADRTVASDSNGETRSGRGCPPGKGFPSLGPPLFPKPPAGASHTRWATGSRHPPGSDQIGSEFTLPLFTNFPF